MSQAVADVMKMINDNEVKFVDFRFTDTRGKEQHVTVPVSHFDEGTNLPKATAFDASSIAGLERRGMLRHAADARPGDCRDRSFL